MVGVYLHFYTQSSSVLKYLIFSIAICSVYFCVTPVETFKTEILTKYNNLTNDDVLL